MDDVTAQKMLEPHGAVSSVQPIDVGDHVSAFSASHTCPTRAAGINGSHTIVHTHTPSHTRNVAGIKQTQKSSRHILYSDTRDDITAHKM